mmetsp:Transcript_78243/g.201463  ORF Transcript_78243/g.201463 Transcript_78243/m.201463 type:complete len:221 (+) Transcript_78243:271-933(+)
MAQGACDRAAARAAALLALAALRQPLQRLLDDLLHALVAVLVAVARDVLNRPLHGGRRRAAVAANCIHSRGVEVRGLPHLHASREADVALVELEGPVEMLVGHPGLPPPRRDAAHGLADQLYAAQPGEAHHVLVYGLVGAVQLRHEEVQQEDNRCNDEEDDGHEENPVRLNPRVAVVAVHVQGHLVQGQAAVRNAAEVRHFLVQGGDRAAEHQQDEEQRE